MSAPRGSMERPLGNAERERLRITFDEAAQLYDRVRPSYPPELFDDLVDLAGIGPNCHILEIGCGTGKATVSLAEQGSAVTAVELGADLAAVAQRNTADFPSVNVIVAPFETWPLPNQKFDMVLAATAFHWIDPAVRISKSAQALRPGGALAVISTHHIAGGDENFFAEVQECYVRWTGSDKSGLPTSADIPLDSKEIDDSHLFSPALFRRYEWEETYSTDGYLDLLRTYSNHRALNEPTRNALLNCIGDLISRRYHGRVTKRYLTQLLLARKRSRDIGEGNIMDL